MTVIKRNIVDAAIPTENGMTLILTRVGDTRVEISIKGIDDKLENVTVWTGDLIEAVKHIIDTTLD